MAFPKQKFQEINTAITKIVDDIEESMDNMLAMGKSTSLTFHLEKSEYIYLVQIGLMLRERYMRAGWDWCETVEVLEQHTSSNYIIKVSLR